MDASVTTAALALAQLRAAARNGATLLQDPRTVQRVTQGSIPIPETCRFYGIQAAISTCRMPRSCQDCLRMPGCVLSGYGQCLNISEPEGRVQYTSEYHLALPSYPLGNAYNRSLQFSDSTASFFSANATYCDASDPVCTDCRAQFDVLADNQDKVGSIQTQFCVGIGGCVCIAVCEVPRVRAPRVYDRTCGQPAPHEMMPAPIKRRNVTMPRRDPRSPPIDFLNRRQTEETCEFHRGRDVQGCRQPRTCQDCLAQPNCVLADSNCASVNTYNASRDFRLSVYHQGDYRYISMSTAMFPSTNTTYCPSSDEFCRAQVMQTARPDTPWAEASTFGVGRDGCVCIQLCESGQWSSGVYDTECTNLGGIGKPTDAPVHVATGAITVIVWVALLVLYKRSKGELVAPSRRAMERAGVRILRHMLDEAPALDRLDLFGWRRFQERLAFKEQQLLRREEVSSPVQHPVDFNLAANAPDFDEDDSSAPVAHDARALASAPAYRASLPDSDEENVDLWAPSAPEFDQEDEFNSITQCLR